MNGFNGDFLRGALDVSPEGVAICEARGDRQVVYVNPAFCRLTGYDVSELAGGIAAWETAGLPTQHGA